MKIVVIGGTGLIGKKLIPLLRARGHEAAVGRVEPVDLIVRTCEGVEIGFTLER